MPGEFEIISRHFRFPQGEGVVLGPGDDCALVAPGAGMQLALTCDVLVAGRHFAEEADPGAVGHKAAAVNLSDLAAQGATPRWALLGLTLPEADEVWLAGFSAGLRAMLEAQGASLVGGDTTRGPLAISLTLIGEVPAGEALTREGAAPGDLLCVSGCIGDAGLALLALQGAASLPAGDWQAVAPRLHRPEPRVALGRRLRGRATACIDVSDGLLADLGHLLEASGTGARLSLEAMPFSAPVRRWIATGGDPLRLLAAGDDYELLFTLPATQREVLPALAREAGVPIAVIGEIEAEPGIRLFTPEDGVVRVEPSGYDHFGKD